MRRPLLMALILVVAGCSVLPARPPAPALHDFGPAAAASSGPGARMSVDAPDWLMSEQIHYRLAFDDPTRVRYYNLDRWLAPPPVLLAQYLSIPAGDDLQVTVRLLDFEQVFDSATSARAVMRFRVSVAVSGDERAGRATEFRLSRPCLTADAKGAVTAFALLVAEARTRLAAWLDDPGAQSDR